MTSLVESAPAGPRAPAQREAAFAFAAGAAALGFAAASFGLASLAAAVAVYLPVAAVALAKVGGHHPFPSYGPANLVTTARAALCALFAGVLAADDAHLAWVLAGLAASGLALDGVDGWLARRSGQASAFGARFDMEVDAVLILLLAFAAWRLDKAGVWILAAGLIRYGFVLAGWAWPRLRAELPPSFRRKLVCVVQTAALVVLVTPLLQPPASIVAGALSLALLAWSFSVDLAWLVKRPA